MAQKTADDDAPLEIDVVGLVRAHGRSSLRAALGVVVVVLALGGSYLLWQPTRAASVLEFRPTFEGAARGTYPNGLAFSPTDVTAAPVVDQVFDSNDILQYCPREAFRGGFFVELRSDQSMFLDAEYQARLAESGLTAVERQSLQAEYESKRAALPVSYRLVFVRPSACSRLPDVVLSKVLVDVLSTWANQSEEKRGVLYHQIEVLTPNMLDVGMGAEGSRLLRADLLRNALLRIVSNIEGVERLPGARLIRFGPDRVTFFEIRSKLLDVVRSRLEPLVVGAGQAMVRESALWVTETAESAERERRAAQGRAEAYQRALQEYSGGTPVVPTAGGRGTGPAAVGTGDVQTLSAQIDKTFIDRIVEMSEANTEFRQELTEKWILESVNEVAAAERASYYARLAQSLRVPSGASRNITPAEIDGRLDDIVKEGKALTALFNQVFDEFSRVSLRPAGAMYQTDRPVSTEVSRSFTMSELVLIAFGAFLAALVAAFAGLVIRERFVATPR